MRVLVALLVLCAFGAPARSDDGDREIARKRYEMGLLLFQRGKYGDALRELEAAKSALDRPEFDYNIGLCLAKLERASEAADALERFVAARPDDPETPAIRQRIIELRAQPKPPESEVEHPPLPPVTTPPPPEPIPPGVSAMPDKNAPPPPRTGAAAFVHSPRGAAAFALGGLAVGTLISSAVTGGLALRDKGSYGDSCNLGACNHADWENARSLGIATDVLWVVGLSSAVITTVLVLTRPKDHSFAAAPGGLVARW